MPCTHRTITVADPTGESGLVVTVDLAGASDKRPQEHLRCACVLLATGSSREGHAIAAALGHEITPPVPSLFTLELGKGSGNPLLGLAGISVGMVEVRLLGPAGGGGAKGFKEVRVLMVWSG